MNYESFVKTMKDRAHLTNTRDALVAIEATLKTLGERLTEAQATHLAAQLPPEIGRFLTVVDTNKSYDLEAFYEHISQRESIGQPASRRHARAVLSIVEETVSPGELRDVLAQLPGEYMDLFTFGSGGRKLEERSDG